MRFLKITLLVCLVVLLTVMVLMFFGVNYDASDPKSKELLAGMLISVGLGIFLGIMALMYHVLSFRYYRRSKRMQTIKKIPAAFMVCAILSHIYFLLISVTILLGTIFNIIKISSNIFSFYLLMFFTFVYAIVSIVEISFLKKRIRLYKADVFLREEIDTIGLSKSN